MMWASLEFMPVIVLLRHGVSSANTAGILAGRTPGVSLTDDGKRALEVTLRMLPHRQFSVLLHSPLLRCVQTAEIALSQIVADRVEESPELIELDYGDWTGKSLKELSATPEWAQVVAHASSVRFPAGESIAEAADRSVARVRQLVDEMRANEKAATGADHASVDEPGDRPQTQWALLVSHGDIIKAVIADALGMPLDDFQRLNVAPGSFTVIDFGAHNPMLSAMSVTAAGLSDGSAPGGGGLR